MGEWVSVMLTHDANLLAPGIWDLAGWHARHTPCPPRPPAPSSRRGVHALAGAMLGGTYAYAYLIQ